MDACTGTRHLLACLLVSPQGWRLQAPRWVLREKSWRLFGGLRRAYRAPAAAVFFSSFLRGRLAALDEVQPLECVRNATRASLVASWLPGFPSSKPPRWMAWMAWMALVAAEEGSWSWSWWGGGGLL